MRRSALFLIALMVAAPALAQASPTSPPKQQTPPVQLHKHKAKTTVNPQPAPAMDPSAGSGGSAAPTAGASNGNET